MKIKIQLFALIFLFSGMAVSTQAATLTRQQSEVRLVQIQQRVEQIKSMDLTHLNRVERTSLRHELKGMNKEIRTMDPIIYISGGALLLIIILLIILL